MGLVRPRAARVGPLVDGDGDDDQPEAGDRGHALLDGLVDHGHAEVLIFDEDEVLGHGDGVEPGLRNGMLPERLRQRGRHLDLVIPSSRDVPLDFEGGAVFRERHPLG